MAVLEHIGDRRSPVGHNLHLLECDSFTEVASEFNRPSPYFVTLFVADFSAISFDELVALTNHLIQRGSRYFCAWGKQCEAAHLAFDLACCEFEDDNECVIPTTDHHNDSIEEAIWYFLNCAYPSEPFDQDCDSAIAICVGSAQHSRTIRTAFRNPDNFSESRGRLVDGH